MNMACVRRVAVVLGVALGALGAAAGPDQDMGVVAVAYDGKTEDVFPVFILDIDGKVQPQPLRDVYYLAPGKHTFRLGAILDSSANVQRSNAYGKDEKRSATERLLSTKALAQVAEKLDPYPLVRETSGMEAVVEKLREDIRVEINPATGSITVIAAHGEGARPAEMAADIVNTLTGTFVKSQRESLDDSAAKAEQFLAQEKARIRRDLERRLYDHLVRVKDPILKGPFEMEFYRQAAADFRKSVKREATSKKVSREGAEPRRRRR